MPLLYAGGKTIFFAHVPKTGGTSVQEYLLRRFGSLAMLGRHRQEATRGTSLIISAAHLSALDLEELLPGNLDWSFAIVRDPIARLLSEYRFQQGASSASRMDFSTWLRLMICAARRDPRVYDNHIRPQVDFLPQGTQFFRLEDGIGSFIPALDGVIGQSASEHAIGHFLKSTSKTIALSRNDVELIVDYYSEDYDEFGYDRPEDLDLPIDRIVWLRNLAARPIGHAIVLRQRKAWLRS